MRMQYRMRPPDVSHSPLSSNASATHVSRSFMPERCRRVLPRISDAEMKALMIEVVNKVYTFLTHLEDVIVLRDSARWNRPEHDPALLAFVKRRAAARQADGEQRE